MRIDNEKMNKFVNIGTDDKPYYTNFYVTNYMQDGMPKCEPFSIINLGLALMYVFAKIKAEPYLMIYDYVLIFFVITYISLYVGCIIKKTNKLLLRFTGGILLNEMAYQTILLISLILEKYIKANYTLQIYAAFFIVFLLWFFVTIKMGNEKSIERTKMRISNREKNQIFRPTVFGILFPVIFIINSLVRNLFPTDGKLNMIAICLNYIPGLFLLLGAVYILASTVLMKIKNINDIE